MRDTIDIVLLDAMVNEVVIAAAEHHLRYIHTVTIELNGAHGGADLTIKGFTGNDVSLYNEKTIKVVVGVAS